MSILASCLIVLSVALKADIAHAKKRVAVCVNVGGTGGCFATIQAAVDSIGKAGTITVSEGAFEENINIPAGKKIEIDGANRQTGITDIRQPSVGTSAITTAKGSTLTLTSLDVSASTAPNGACILANGSLTLSDVFILGCKATGGSPDNGGGVFFAGSGKLVISNSLFMNNVADGMGGALYSAGNTTITNTLFDSNHSTGDGGAANFTGGKIKLSNTAFLNNFTNVGNGGGVNLSGGKLNGANLTFHSNFTAANGAQLMVAGGTATLNSSTLDGGGASGNGGGIAANNASSVTISNTILAKNLVNGSGPDCSPGLTSKGFNLIFSTSGCAIGGNQTGVITAQDPMFTASLTCLNGIVCVREISNSSPAKDAGNPKKATGKGGSCTALDPLGTPRPTGGCDIGAFEIP